MILTLKRARVKCYRTNNFKMNKWENIFYKLAMFPFYRKKNKKLNNKLIRWCSMWCIKTKNYNYDNRPVGHYA